MSAFFLRSFVSIMAAGIAVLLLADLRIIALALAALFAISFWLYFDFGFLRLMLNLSKGNKATFGLLFAVPNIDFLNFVLVSIIVFIGFAVGSILLVIPGFYFLSRFCLSLPLIIDRRAGIKEAFADSLRMTKGSTLALFGIICITLLPLILLKGVSDIFVDSLLWISICYFYAHTASASTSRWKPERPKVLNAVAAIVFMLMGVLCTVFITLIGMRSTIEARFIPSSAMTPTLQVNDRILLEKACKYGIRQLRRGDIIVFYAPPSELPGGKDIRPGPLQLLGRATGLPVFPNELAFVKRVIALPGETIKVVRGVGIYINGQLLDEPYIQEQPDYDLRVMGDIGPRPIVSADQASQPIVIPPNHLFLLGDNRCNSQDSHVWGFLDANRVIGRAWLKFSPRFTFF